MSAAVDLRVAELTVTGRSAAEAMDQAAVDLRKIALSLFADEEQQQLRSELDRLGERLESVASWVRIEIKNEAADSISVFTKVFAVRGRQSVWPSGRL